MICKFKYQALDGMHSVEVWAEQDKLVMRHSLKPGRTIPLISLFGGEDLTAMGAEVEGVFSQDLAKCCQYTRTGSTLQLLTAITRLKLEDPI